MRAKLLADWLTSVHCRCNTSLNKSRRVQGLGGFGDPARLGFSSSHTLSEA